VEWEWSGSGVKGFGGRLSLVGHRSNRPRAVVIKLRTTYLYHSNAWSIIHLVVRVVRVLR